LATDILIIFKHFSQYFWCRLWTRCVFLYFQWLS